MTARKPVDPAWEWRCLACGKVFRGGTAVGAERQFQDHAREVHDPKVVLSINTEENR